MMFVTRDKIRGLLESEAKQQTNARSQQKAVESKDHKNGEPDEKQGASSTNESTHKNPPNVTIDETVREPMYWRQHLDNIRQMRASRDAPVDSMGASACADVNVGSSTRRFQILVALMLSSQTKDETTAAAMEKLKAKGCTAQTLAKTPETELAETIYPVGFFKRKAEFIKRAAQICVDEYEGDVPGTYDELCALPGVGPKMATLMMNLAWKKPVGVGVDVHVHRIANRLGWTTRTTRTPEETEKALTRWMPKDLWDEVNVLFVGFGQQICTSNKPKCEDCLNQGICPYAMGGAF